MHHEDRLRPWLALVRTPGLGPVQIRRLLDAGWSPQSLLDAEDRVLRALGLAAPARQALRCPDAGAVARDLDWLAQSPDRHILTWDDPGYPPRLREIPAPPPVLYVRGQPGCLGTPQLAIVGSRNPTPAGAELARGFAAELGRFGLTITSGLALGIDAQAHRGALEQGAPTVAVLGTGPDCCYPARHRSLAEAIAAGGALVSEFPPGTGPRAEHFPRRNRLISGLSLGCLVVEAALRSGSLITARIAAEQGREVFAIPGSVHNPLARGSHALLREGAALVEEVADIVREIAPQLPQPGARGTPGEPRQETAELTDSEHKLLAAMGFEPVSVDSMVVRSGLTADRVSSILLNLELRGYAASSPGGLYCRVQKWGNDERERP